MVCRAVHSAGAGVQGGVSRARKGDDCDFESNWKPSWCGTSLSAGPAALVGAAAAAESTVEIY